MRLIILEGPRIINPKYMIQAYIRGTMLIIQMDKSPHEFGIKYPTADAAEDALIHLMDRGWLDEQ